MVGIATTCLLVACQPQGPEARFQNYLSRLGRTLSVDVPTVNPPMLPRAPRTGQLQIDIQPGSLDALDFLALSGCAVQVTIGKRNSSLGRLARPSQRLLLELEYLQLAPQCIIYQREQDRNALADTLEQAWKLKRQQLPALIFNATLGGEEYRALWHTPVTTGLYPHGTSSQVITALEAINGQIRRWLAGDYQAHNRDFEILLSEVAAGDGGVLLKALAIQDAWLSAADTILAERMAKGPLCTASTRPAAATILPNVIRKYFIGEIQADAASLGRRYHTLLPPAAALEDLLNATLPQLYRDWQSTRNARFAQLMGAPRRHVEQLKLIQQPCITL